MQSTVLHSDALVSVRHKASFCYLSLSTGFPLTNTLDKNEMQWCAVLNYSDCFSFFFQLFPQGDSIFHVKIIMWHSQVRISFMLLNFVCGYG